MIRLNALIAGLLCCTFGIFASPLQLDIIPIHQPAAYGAQLKFKEAVPADVDRLHDTGFTAMRLGVRRQDFDDPASWDRLDELMRAAQQNDMSVLLTVMDGGIRQMAEAPRSDAARTRYANFIDALVRRYQQNRVAIELWNEPFNATFWQPQPSVLDYANLVEASCKLLRRRGITVPIYAGSLAVEDPPSPFTAESVRRFRPLIKSGCVTAISVHPYRSSNPEKALRELRSMAPKLPIVITEWGYSRVSQFRPQPMRDAYIARILLLAPLLPTDLVILYEWRDSGNDPNNKEHNFGLVDRVGRPKSALPLVKCVLEILQTDPKSCSPESARYCLATQAPEQRFEWRDLTASLPVGLGRACAADLSELQ